MVNHGLWFSAFGLIATPTETLDSPTKSIKDPRPKAQDQGQNESESNPRLLKIHESCYSVRKSNRATAFRPRETPAPISARCRARRTRARPPDAESAPVARITRRLCRPGKPLRTHHG